MTRCTQQSHEALKANPALWKTLDLRGIQDGLGNDQYELRNCGACESTLALKLDNTEAPVREAA